MLSTIATKINAIQVESVLHLISLYCGAGLRWQRVADKTRTHAQIHTYLVIGDGVGDVQYTRAREGQAPKHQAVKAHSFMHACVVAQV